LACRQEDSLFCYLILYFYLLIIITNIPNIINLGDDVNMFRATKIIIMYHLMIQLKLLYSGD